MRITLVSDAWSPQVNGVVRTLSTVTDIATARGHRVQTITPDRFFSVPMPSYPEIRLAMTTRRKIATKIAGFDPDAVHIATEGPLGWLARGWCHNFIVTVKFRGDEDYKVLERIKRMLDRRGAEFCIRHLQSNKNEVTVMGALPSPPV